MLTFTPFYTQQLKVDDKKKEEKKTQKQTIIHIKLFTGTVLELFTSQLNNPHTLTQNTCLCLKSVCLQFYSIFFSF